MNLLIRLAGQPTVIGEPDHLTSQQLKRPACTPLRRAGAGSGNQKRLLLARADKGAMWVLARQS